MSTTQIGSSGFDENKDEETSGCNAVIPLVQGSTSPERQRPRPCDLLFCDFRQEEPNPFVLRVTVDYRVPQFRPQLETFLYDFETKEFKPIEEFEFPSAEAYQQFYETKSIDELLLFAYATTSDVALLSIADVLPKQLSLETQNGKNTSLSETRLSLFDNFVLFTSLCVPEIKTRIIRLGILVTFLEAYEDEFFVLCNPRLGITDKINQLLNRFTYKKEELIDEWREAEFKLIMEISEWFERALYSVRAYRPNSTTSKYYWGSK